MRDKLAPVIKQESFPLKLVTEKEPFLSEKTLSEAETNRPPYLFSLLDCSLSHHACAVVIQLCPWAQDLNFKRSDRAIVTKSPPAVEWHGAFLIMQITPCRGPWGHFTGNSGKLLRPTESACSGDTIYLSYIKSLDISLDL